MPASTTLFEGLDLLDLWHVYGSISIVSTLRNTTPSKISRQTSSFLNELGLDKYGRGAPDLSRLQDSAVLQLLRLAYQEWRLQHLRLKIFPTFAASSAFSNADSLMNLDVLYDMHLSADALALHLNDRRIDIVVSSCLDLAGECIQEAQNNPNSPYVVIALFQEPLLLSLNPTHPLAGMKYVTADDCRDFPSAGYPEGIASLGAQALQDRGLWKFPCKKPRFALSEWQIGMTVPVGLCYKTSHMMTLAPECKDLIEVSLDKPLSQTVCILALKDLLNSPAFDVTVATIRRLMLDASRNNNHPVEWLT